MLPEDALSFTESYSFREPGVLEEQWAWFLEASAWSIRRLHDTVMVIVPATSQSTAPLTTIVVTPLLVVLPPTISVPQSNYSLKKMSNGNFWKQEIYKFYLLVYVSFTFYLVIHLCSCVCCIYVCPHWVWRSEVNVGCLPLFFSTFFICLLLRQGLSLDLELSNWLDCMNPYVCLLILN